MPPRKKVKTKQAAEYGEEQQDDEQPPPADSKESTNTTSNRAEDSITHTTIPFGDKEIICERQGSLSSPPSLIFTHGAGGGIDSPACRDFASGFSQTASILSFQGSMNLKNRIKAFHTVLSHSKAQHGNDKHPALGGRSMGARAAVLTALELEEMPAAMVLVSYPLMAGSNGDKREPERRERILSDLEEEVDVLFVIGSEDKMCDLAMLVELRGRMKARSWVCVVRGADHGMSLRPKKAVREVRERSGSVAARWLREREEGKRWCEVWWDEEEGNVRVGEWKSEEGE